MLLKSERGRKKKDSNRLRCCEGNLSCNSQLPGKHRERKSRICQNHQMDVFGVPALVCWNKTVGETQESLGNTNNGTYLGTYNALIADEYLAVSFSLVASQQGIQCRSELVDIHDLVRLHYHRRLFLFFFWHRLECVLGCMTLCGTYTR